MSLDPDNHENDQISGVDGYHHQKANAQTSDDNDIAKAKETVEKGEEEICNNTCQTDQCLVETELSLSDQSYFSPTLSCFGSDSKASGDNCYDVPEESPSPLKRQSSGTELQESVASDHESPKSNGVVRKPGNSRNWSRNRSLIRERQNHQNERPCRVSERRIPSDNDFDASPISRDQSSIDCGRQIGRLHDFDYYNRRDFSYYRQRDLAFGGDERFVDNGDERFVDNNVQAVYTKHFHKTHHRGFRDELKSRERRNKNEKDYFHERNFRLDNEDDMYRHWDNHGRGLSPENMVPFTCKPRRLVSKYDNFKGSDVHWRSDKIQFGKRTSNDSYLLHHKNVDDLIQEKYGRSVSFGNRKRESLDEKYVRHGPLIGREVNLSGRRARYGDNPLINLDSSWCMEMEDDYPNPGHRHLSSRSYRESYADNDGGWWDMVSPRSDIFDSRLTEGYVRCKRKMCDGEGWGSDWVGSYNDHNEDGIIYPDDEVHVGRRKYSWRSRVAHCTQDESILRGRNDEFYAERTSWSYGVTSRHERVHSKSRSANGGMVVNDMQLECRGYKILREERSANFVNRNPNRMHRGNHQQMVRRCSDPVDFGEGKVKLGKLSSKPCIAVIVCISAPLLSKLCLFLLMLSHCMFVLHLFHAIFLM